MFLCFFVQQSEVKIDSGYMEVLHWRVWGQRVMLLKGMKVVGSVGKWV